MAMEENAGRGYCHARRESTLKYVLYGGNFLTRPPTGTPRRTIYLYIARARAFCFLLCTITPLAHGSRRTILHCAHRTSTVLSCAFCEQKGWPDCSPPTILRPRVARAQEII